MGKVLTDADFGIDGGRPAATTDNDEPVIDAGDLEVKPVIEDGTDLEDLNKPVKKEKLIAGKYKTIPDAESGIKEAERKMHEANERAARAEGRLSAQTVRKEPDVDPADAIADAAIEEIGKLNPEDPEYQKKTARVWARAQQKIAGLTVSSARESDNSNRSVEERVVGALKDAKLSSDNDKKIFYSIATHVPAGISEIGEQIAWVVERVKEIKAEVAKEVAEEITRKKKEKGDLKVLGRKNSKVDAIEDDEEKTPMTLSEQLKASRRRV